MFESITQEFVIIMRKHCYRNGTKVGRPVLVITVNSGTQGPIIHGSRSTVHYIYRLLRIRCKTAQQYTCAVGLLLILPFCTYVVYFFTPFHNNNFSSLKLHFSLIFFLGGGVQSVYTLLGY